MHVGMDDIKAPSPIYLPPVCNKICQMAALGASSNLIKSNLAQINYPWLKCMLMSGGDNEAMQGETVCMLQEAGVH